MHSRQPYLRSELGPIAEAFAAGSAGANVRVIQTLPPRERDIAREAFSQSLSSMWIVYVAFSAAGLVTSFLIGRNVLGKTHEETVTGLEEEARKKKEREAERVERRRKRREKGVVVDGGEDGHSRELSELGDNSSKDTGLTHSPATTSRHSHGAQQQQHPAGR